VPTATVPKLTLAGVAVRVSAWAAPGIKLGRSVVNKAATANSKGRRKRIRG